MQYNPALDGLRALAVLAVVAFHCEVPFMWGGFVGVDLFFVLSGYLITTILHAEAAATGRVDLLRFYWNRALRLWPALLLMLAAYVALVDDENRWRDALLAGLYLSDYTKAFADVPDWLSHTWSLSVEEHFYLLWPFVVMALAKIPPRRAVLFLAAAFVLATAWRFAELLRWDAWDPVYYRFDTRMSGLVLGSLIAIAPLRLESGAAAWIIGVALTFLAVAVSCLAWERLSVLGSPAFAVDLAAGALVLSLVSDRPSRMARALAQPRLVYLGTISYGIYLWHYPIARMIRDLVPDGLALLVVLPASVAIAAASYELVEKPLRRFRMARTPQAVAA